MRRLRGKLKDEPPTRMLLQWHVTEQCNMRCSHCYQETSPGEELDFTDFLWILDQFQDLVRARSHELGRRIMGHVTLTGGEPFVREDFMDLVQAVSAARDWTRFSILSNGSLIDGKLAPRLARLNPAYVQLSMEGAEETHDRIRGEGNFRQTVAAVKRLKRAGIPVMLSFTAHRDNFREFGEVARWGCRLGVSKVWADRLIPMGRGAAAEPLTTDETRAFFRIMRDARDGAQKRWFNSTQVVLGRALQFLEGGGLPYHCSAGRSLITVLPDGTLVPCRRMPIPAGNVMENSMTALYYTSPVMQALRDESRLSPQCKPCKYKKQCRGGLRCLSYAETGDPFARDPGCYAEVHFKTESEPETERKLQSGSRTCSHS